MDLRKLPDDFDRHLRNDSGMTMILMDGDKKFSFENTRLGKDQIVQSFRDGDSDCVLLLAWTGQYKTDIFEITEEDLDKHYK